MSQYQRQGQFIPEIDYNGLVRQALITVIDLPRISDLLSENVPQAGIMRTTSRFSPERFDRAVRTVSRMIVKRMRDADYENLLKKEKDPEKVWEGLIELLDRNGFWQQGRTRKAHLGR